MKDLFFEASIQTSRLVTRLYSTSFSLGVRMLNRRFRDPIYAIYGFVRFADEIVDTFQNYDKKLLLDQFREDTYKAIRSGISLNPVLNSFQWVVNKYQIDTKLIDTFLHSMEMDLSKTTYTRDEYNEYILGSAEVIGLMCLQVFCEGNNGEYERLKPLAMKLGSAYQKINFLRDLRQDNQVLGRNYFPGIDIRHLTVETKHQIEQEIEQEFRAGLKGIKQLPPEARLGVYLTYVYYTALLNKIKKTTPEDLLRRRVRIPDLKKWSLLVFSYLLFKVRKT